MGWLDSVLSVDVHVEAEGGQSPPVVAHVDLGALGALSHVEGAVVVSAPGVGGRAVEHLAYSTAAVLAQGAVPEVHATDADHVVGVGVGVGVVVAGVVGGGGADACCES